MSAHHPHHPAIPQDDSIASQNEERGRTIRVRCVLAKAKHAMGPSRQAWLVARGLGLPFLGAAFGGFGASAVPETPALRHSQEASVR